MQRGVCHNTAGPSGRSPRPACGAAPRTQPVVVVTCSLRSEKKRLAKALKAHTRRIERLLDTPPASPASSVALEAPQQLERLVAELQQLNHTLSSLQAQAQAHPTAAAAAALHAACAVQWPASSHACDDAGSDSESDDARCTTAPSGTPVVASLAVLAAAPAASSSSSRSSSSLLRDLEVPRLDDDSPSDVVLPPAAAYGSTGRVLVCQGSSCVAKGAHGVLRAVSHATSASPGIDVLPCKCLGKCSRGAAVRVKTANGSVALYTQVQPQDVARHIHHHFSDAHDHSQQPPVQQQQQQQQQQGPMEP